MVLIISCMLYFGITLNICLNGCTANKSTSRKWVWNWVYVKDACGYMVPRCGLVHPFTVSACAAIGTSCWMNDWHKCQSVRGSWSLFACEFLSKYNWRESLIFYLFFLLFFFLYCLFTFLYSLVGFLGNARMISCSLAQGFIKCGFQMS